MANQQVINHSRLTLFRGSNRPIKVLPSEPNPETCISGVTVLGGELFVVKATSQVDVYNITNYELIRTFIFPDAVNLYGLVSCSHINCLYVSDYPCRAIRRYYLPNGETSSWSSGGECYGLSVTAGYNVLATIFDTQKVIEYTTNGDLIREINLDASIDHPWHCVQFSSGNLVVSQRRYLHRLCVVDEDGRLIQSYGNVEGNGEGQLDDPFHIAVDADDNIAVTVGSNDRVQLFDSSLTYIGDAMIFGPLGISELNHPYAIHHDPSNDRMYVGLFNGRRLLIIN